MIFLQGINSRKFCRQLSDPLRQTLPLRRRDFPRRVGDLRRFRPRRQVLRRGRPRGVRPGQGTGHGEGPAAQGHEGGHEGQVGRGGDGFKAVNTVFLRTQHENGRC